jgi:hypothetical protein
LRSAVFGIKNNISCLGTKNSRNIYLNRRMNIDCVNYLVLEPHDNFFILSNLINALLYLHNLCPTNIQVFLTHIISIILLYLFFRRIWKSIVFEIECQQSKQDPSKGIQCTQSKQKDPLLASVKNCKFYKPTA